MLTTASWLPLVLAVSVCLLAGVCCRPPVQSVVESTPSEESSKEEWDLGIEYNRYLQEVVQVLESDADFRKKLEEADVKSIKDGSIAEDLQFVDHNIRSQLDDAKRRELDRLRQLAMRRFEETELGMDRKHLKVPDHVDVGVATFEKEDLAKLIRSTSRDLEEADRKRRDDFKHYEMEKKFREEERLKHIEDEEKRKQEEQRMHDMKEKHKQHEKPHHPMTKEQLEEVWEEQDHMRPEDFDPKTFFSMHDLNGDRHLDEEEIKALFQKELNKVYDPNAPEDDLRERQEEMERMREHVFKEADKNGDRLIDFNEFLEETQRSEYESDPGWDTLDNFDDDFSDEEFRAYEAQREREIQDMIAKGIVPPGYPYYGDVPPGAQPYALPHNMGIPGQPAFVPQGGQFAGQVPQGHPGMVQPGQVPQGHPQMAQHGQVPQGQPQMAQHGQVPQGHPGMVQPGQVPQGHPQMAQHGQVPQGQPQMAQPPQVPQGQPQMAQPPQVPQGHPQMVQPGQIPQGQPQMAQPGQVPQGQPQMAQRGQVPQGQPQVVQPQMAQPQMPQPGQVPQGQPQMVQPGQAPQGQPQMIQRGQDSPQQPQARGQPPVRSQSP